MVKVFCLRRSDISDPVLFLLQVDELLVKGVNVTVYNGQVRYPVFFFNDAFCPPHKKIILIMIMNS